MIGIKESIELLFMVFGSELIVISTFAKPISDFHKLTIHDFGMLVGFIFLMVSYLMICGVKIV